MTQNIHLIFKTHLDVGFTDYASVVVDNYFKKYIPASLKVAREMRLSDRPERFIWTTGSWLIYEYLEQAIPVERKEMEEAIELGEIAWHALPFTTHTELMDPELYRFGLSLSQSLDHRFGRKTTAAKLTDVPGHTRGIVPLLAEAGVTFLHVGVNPGSTVPSVPRLFRWRDESGAEVSVMYESGYGDAFVIEGLDDSLAYGHTSDNLGPQSSEQVLDVYREKRSKFPGANVFASTLSQFAQKLDLVKGTLPVLEQEIGDTWIHGIGSDPIKVSRYRELLRLRLEWLRDKKTSYSDRHFFDFNRRLLLVPEHTWGMDEKTWLGDHENYDAASFSTARGSANFRKFESSWIEKRGYIAKALSELEGTPLGKEANTRIECIRPKKPDLTGWEILPGKQGTVSTLWVEAMFDLESGSMTSLWDKTSQTQWADEDHPWGNLRYQTFSAADYERFYQQYIIPEMRTSEWPKEDFAKPGLEQANPVHKMWKPQARKCYTRRSNAGSKLLFNLAFDSDSINQYGAPAEVFLLYTFPDDASEVQIEVQWFKKPACRMPEALWFGFIPILQAETTCRLQKLGRMIPPLDVVENGNRHLHAVGDFVEYAHQNASCKIYPLDSPLAAPGTPSLLNFTNDQPDLTNGIHFCLLNNLWGTNFPMWFEEDCRFRFIIKF